MRVDEGRRERAAGDVDDFMRLALTPARHHTVGERKRGVDPLAPGRAEHAPAREQQIGGLVPAGDGNRPWSRLRPRHHGQRIAAPYAAIASWRDWASSSPSREKISASSSRKPWRASRVR